MLLLRLPGGASGKKNPRANAGDRRDTCLILGLGRSPGGGMAVHSSILAWEIPWTEEPGGLQSIGLERVRHDLVTKPPLCITESLCFIPEINTTIYMNQLKSSIK